MPRRWVQRGLRLPLLWLPLCLGLLLWDPSAPASAPKLAALCVLALLSSGYAAYRRTPVQLSLPLSAALVWIVWSGVSLLWGSAQGLRQQCLLLACGSIAWVARSGLSQADLREQLQTLARFLGVGSAGWALGQFISGARGSFVHGGAGNPNWLGLLLAVCLVLSLPGTAELKHRWRWLLFAALALQTTGLWLAQSRVAGFALGAGLVYFGLRRVVPRGLHWLSIAALLLPLLAAWLSEPAQLLHGGADGWQAALAGRRWIWHATLEAWRAAPWGVGGGEFASSYLEAQGRVLEQLPLREAARAFQVPGTAHSDWLQCLLEQGPLGAALMLLWFASALRARGWWRGEVALVVVFVSAIADTPLTQPAVVLLALLTSAALGKTFRRGIIARRVGARAWWGLLLVLGLATRHSAAAWLAQRSASAAREAPEQRLGLLTQATQLYDSDSELWLDQGLALLDAGEPQRAVEAAETSLKLSRSVAGELLLAKALSSGDRGALAISRLTEARRLSPGSFRVNLALAALHVHAGHVEAATQHLDDAALVLPAEPSIAILRKRIELAKQAQELR